MEIFECAFGDNTDIHYIVINSLNNGSRFTVFENYQ